ARRVRRLAGHRNAVACVAGRRADPGHAEEVCVERPLLAGAPARLGSSPVTAGEPARERPAVPAVSRRRVVELLRAAAGREAPDESRLALDRLDPDPGRREEREVEELALDLVRRRLALRERHVLAADQVEERAADAERGRRDERDEERAERNDDRELAA